MSGIRPDEKVIECTWVEKDGALIPSDECERIRVLLQSGELEKIGNAVAGWSSLFRAVADGRYWELCYPHSEMHGGGPPLLRSISEEEVHARFKLDDSAS